MHRRAHGHVSNARYCRIAAPLEQLADPHRSRRPSRPATSKSISVGSTTLCRIGARKLTCARQTVRPEDPVPGPDALRGQRRHPRPCGPPVGWAAGIRGIMRVAVARIELLPAGTRGRDDHCLAAAPGQSQLAGPGGGQTRASLTVPARWPGPSIKRISRGGRSQRSSRSATDSSGVSGNRSCAKAAPIQLSSGRPVCLAPFRPSLRQTGR
jgi:hypothetical protein